MDLQLSVALLIGTAAAMIVPPVRRSVPRWIEAVIWLGLIAACWLVVTNLKDANVRFLTDSLAWGVDQVVKTSFGLMLASAFAWMSEHRFPIAYATVMLLGADALLLALLRTNRQAEAQLPRILLGEWIEIPLHTPVEVPYAMEVWNRRAEHAAAMVAAAFLTWLVNLLVWARDVVVPPAVIVFRRVAFGDSGHALTDDQVINISALLRVQSTAWYGPILPVRAGKVSDTEEGREDESDQLAS